MSMNVSLDGCADHRVAVADDELHDFALKLLNNVDILLFGRVTYELMESYWPHAHEDPNATGSMIRFAHKINAMPKIVFSKTLEKAEWNNTSLVRNNLVEEVIKLKRESGKALSVGGISVCQELMRRGLIDEYWILVQPVIWGKGRRLFDDSTEKKIKLKLVDTKAFSSGVVVLHYLQIPST
jgi:dihydrofolate reductase